MTVDVLVGVRMEEACLCLLESRRPKKKHSDVLYVPVLPSAAHPEQRIFARCKRGDLKVFSGVQRTGRWMLEEDGQWQAGMGTA